MPRIDLPLDPRRRPVVEVQVAVPAALARALTQSGQAVPQPLRLSGLIDTGASRTCIDHHVRGLLRLRGFSTLVVSAPTAGTAAQARRHLYKANLHILHPSGDPQQHLARNAFTVVAVPLRHLGVDVLIGRDLLAGCRFLYDGQAGTLRLEY
ncbi:MAG TPA: hypothetical protein VJ739_13935 [Gemmataceae bacterium]|nr:hypothetical protein [Gemmataceae bacterium]